MTSNTPRESEGRILPFRPRGSLFARHIPRPPPVEDLDVKDLGKFERTPEEADDYRHRMLMNGLALLATIILVAVGIWIADTMAKMRKNQDCYLAGRPACNQMQIPPAQR